MDIEIVLSIVQTLLAMYGVLYLVTSIVSPAWFLDNLSVDELDRKSSRMQPLHIAKPRWRFWVQAVLTVFGMGVLIYAAMSAVVQVIPASWGEFTGDGEWRYTRRTIQFGAAVYGTYILCTRLEKNAQSIIWSRIYELSSYALLDAFKVSRLSKDQIIELARNGIEKKFEQDEFKPEDWAMKAQIEHKEHCLSVLNQSLEASAAPNGPNNL